MTLSQPLSISQIAWDTSEEVEIANLMVDMGVGAVELAPPRLFADPGKPLAGEIRACRSFWESRGINPVAFQSLLYGRPDLKLFGSIEARKAMLEYLLRQIAAAGELGVGALVFGSPQNRAVPEGMQAHTAQQIAIDAFGRLGEAAVRHGVYFCIEPNPVDYGCNYVTNAVEGIELVQAVGSSGFGVHLDSAGMWLAGDDYAISIRDAAPWLRHFHISAPQLDQITENGLPYRSALVALGEVGYRGVVSIEMRAADVGLNLARVREVLRFVQAL